jgi:hypothetical protein
MKSQYNKKQTTLSSSKDIIEYAQASINGKEAGANVIIANPCNNVDKYIGQVNKKISKVYPEAEVNYHLLGKIFLKNNPGYVQFIDVDREPTYNRRLIVANMVCLNSVKSSLNPRTINYAYLVKSMVEIKKYTVNNFNTENKVKIYVPKTESRYSSVDKKFLSLLIEDIWSNIEVVVF